MSRTKIEHFIPQFYLRYFANSKEQLFAFDKQSKRSFPTNIQKIAAHKYFYDIHPLLLPEGTDPQFVEKGLAVIEGTLAKEYPKVIESIDQRTPINSEQQWHLAVSMALQRARVPQLRDFAIEYAKRCEQQPEGLPADVSNYLYDKVVAPSVHAKFMFDLAHEKLSELRDIFLKHIWIFGYHNTTKSFYISDNPIVKIPHASGQIGLACRGIEIVFPLTPKCILTLYEREFHKHRGKDHLQVRRLTSDDVKRYNSAQVQQSIQWVYCQSDDFGLARSCCRANPKICDPEHNRKMLFGSTP